MSVIEPSVWLLSLESLISALEAAAVHSFALSSKMMEICDSGRDPLDRRRDRWTMEAGRELMYDMPDAERDRGLGCEMTTGAALLRRRRHGAEKTAPIFKCDDEERVCEVERREGGWVKGRAGALSCRGQVKYMLGLG